MRKDVSVGLYFIVGTCYGNIIRHDEDLVLTIGEKEDYQRSIQYYLKDGAVVRLDSITIKSAFYTEPGGLQHGDRGAREEVGAKALVKAYPDLCSMYYRKTTGFAEIRLRDSRPKPVEVPDNNIESFF